MLDTDIKRVSKYLKAKYPNRYTLKIAQVASEFLVDKKRIKELQDSRELSSLGIKAVATYIVQHPAKRII